MATRRDRWELDPDDGLKREIVHHWVEEKHERLRKYVDISKGVRMRFAGRCTYIDLYAGTGRARVLETGEVVDGGSLVAAKEAARQHPFSAIHVGDADPEHTAACGARLDAAGFPHAFTYVGPAEATARTVASKLDPYGLHLAFLDPFNLPALPFSVIETLGRFKRMDLLIHMSLQDLQREAFGKQNYPRLDVFAPGWRDSVDLQARPVTARLEFLQYWLSKIRALGYKVRDNSELVTGDKNQPLYLLVFAAKHDRADEFWEKIRHIGAQGRLAL